jgi:hypothetical protein
MPGIKAVLTAVTVIREFFIYSETGFLTIEILFRRAAPGGPYRTKIVEIQPAQW